MQISRARFGVLWESALQDPDSFGVSLSKLLTGGEQAGEAVLLKEALDDLFIISIHGRSCKKREKTAF